MLMEDASYILWFGGLGCIGPLAGQTHGLGKSYLASGMQPQIPQQHIDAHLKSI